MPFALNKQLKKNNMTIAIAEIKIVKEVLIFIKYY